MATPTVRRLAESALVLLALLAAVAPFPPQLVERWFSTTWYPAVQRFVTPLSNQVPVALFDAIVGGLVVGAIVMLIRAVKMALRTRTLRPVFAAIGHLVAAGAAVYLVFLLAWGFNYRRLPMTERLLVTQGPPSTEQVVALGKQAVAEMNRLHRDAHATGWPGNEVANEPLRDGFRLVQRELSDANPAVPGRLKWTVFGPYFRWTSVDGMVDPFALEVLANPDLLPWERPFVAAHEWAHLAGYADEAEANFVGWLTCLRGDAASRYSGWMYLYFQVSGEMSPADRAPIAAAIDEGPRRDINGIAERLRRGQLPLLRSASWIVYDQYLKANRVEAGIRSYGAVVTLILRARFEDGWVPVRRESARPPGS